MYVCKFEDEWNKMIMVDFVKYKFIIVLDCFCNMSLDMIKFLDNIKKVWLFVVMGNMVFIGMDFFYYFKWYKFVGVLVMIWDFISFVFMGKNGIGMYFLLLCYY